MMLYRVPHSHVHYIDSQAEAEHHSITGVWEGYMGRSRARRKCVECYVWLATDCTPKRLSRFQTALEDLGVRSLDDMELVQDADLVEGMGMTIIQKRRFQRARSSQQVHHWDDVPLKISKPLPRNGNDTTTDPESGS